MKVKQFKRTNLVNNNIYQLTLPDLNMFQREKKLLNIVTPYQIYEMERDKSFRNIRQKHKGVFKFNVNIHHYNSNPYFFNLTTLANLSEILRNVYYLKPQLISCQPYQRFVI